MLRIIGFFLLLISAHAASAHSRHALVIGVDAHENQPIPENALVDEPAVGIIREQAGHRIERQQDPAGRDIGRTMVTLSIETQQTEKTTFFFADQGAGLADRNLLLPTNMPLARPRQESLLLAEADPCELAQILWLQISRTDDPASLRVFIERFGDCQALMPLAEERLRELTVVQERATVTMEDCSSIFPMAMMALSSGDDAVIDRFLRENEACMALIAASVGLDMDSFMARPRANDLRLSDRIDPALHAEDWQFAGTLGRHNASGIRIAVSDHFGRVATSDADGGIQVFDIVTGQRLSSFRFPTEGLPLAFAFHPTQGQLIVRNPFWDHVRVVESTSGREVARWNAARLDRGLNLPLTIPPSADALVVGGHSYNLLTISERRPRMRLITWSHAAMAELTSARFSGNGRNFIVGDIAGEVRAYDGLRASSLQGILATHSNSVTDVLFLNEDKMILTIAGTSNLYIWDAAPEGGFMALAGLDGGSQRQPIATLAEHTDTVTAAAVSPDGRRIATGAGNGEIIIWEAATGQAFQTLLADDQAVNALAFAPDSQQLITVHMDGNIRAWRADYP